MKKDRIILTIGIVIVTIFSIVMLIKGFYFIYKGAFNSGVGAFIVVFMNLGWLLHYYSEIRNIELRELIETHAGFIKMHERIQKDFIKERIREIVISSKRTEATVEEVDKIIELSRKRMVNGLSEERYICFINEVLHAIHSFAERAKHNLLNRIYEVKEDE